MLPTTAPTLYPKITQHVSDVVRVLRELEEEPGRCQENESLTCIPFTGSVKLHGTHANILIYSDDKIILQSKNVSNVTMANDNQGFAAAMADKTLAILELRDRIFARWRQLNPDSPSKTQYPILIAGEWIGTNLQKGVAISQLSRRFVIISISVNNSWIQDAQFSDIETPSSSMYNVSRGGKFSVTLYPNDVARTIAEVEALAEQVASSCPFAASFGTNGDGEGIVWKPVPSHLSSNPALWFKTKGGRFKPTFAPALKALPGELQEKREAADAVGRIWCTEERLRQGWDFLEEVGVKTDMKGLGRYLGWVQHDILTEERGYIKDHGIDEGMLRVGIAKIAKVWYIRRVGEE